MSIDEPDKNETVLMGIRDKHSVAAVNATEKPFKGGEGSESHRQYTNLKIKRRAPETAWEAYNHRAAIYDKELIKDWNESLNTLLIFAALYSAVLTAFISESMKLLEEDPTETTRDILLVVSQQLANASTPAYQHRSFIVPAFAVRVNTYFFISISSSLITAFGSVLALQWVGSYDFGLNPSSPKDRALQRHFRFKGIQDWKMVETIALLPILLFLALFLFLIGLGDWLFHVHRGISAITMMGVALSAIFYVTTTIISIRHADAPFRTPVSKYLPIVYQAFLQPFRKLGFFVHRSIFGHYDDQIGHDDVMEGYTFEKREEQTIKETSVLELDCLLWMANSIDVLPHARETFKVLIEAFMNLPTNLLLHPNVKRAPWLSIFNMLCQPYFSRKKRKDYGEEELRSGEIPFLAQALAMIGKDMFHGPGSENIQAFVSSLLSPLLSYEPLLLPTREGSESESTMVETHNLVNAYARQARCLHMPRPRPWEYLLSLRSILAGPSFYPASFAKLSLTRLQMEQAKRPALFYEDRFLGDIHQYVSKYNEAVDHGLHGIQNIVIPSELLETILQMMTTDLAGRSVGSSSSSQFSPYSSYPAANDALVRYLSAYEEAEQSGILQPEHEDALNAIRRQYIARLEGIPEEIQLSQDFSNVFYPIDHMLSSTSSDVRNQTVDALLQLFVDLPFSDRLWNFSNEILASLASLVLCEKPILHITNWQEWFIQVTLGCDKQIAGRASAAGTAAFLNTKSIIDIVNGAKPKNISNMSDIKREDDVEHALLSFLTVYCRAIDRIHDTYFNVPGGINTPVIGGGSGAWLESIKTPYVKLVLAAAFFFPGPLPKTFISGPIPTPDVNLDIDANGKENSITKSIAKLTIISRPHSLSFSHRKSDYYSPPRGDSQPDAISSIYSLLTSIPMELWNDPLWQDAVQWTCGFIRTSGIPTSPAFVAFVRAAFAHGSHGTRVKCAKLMARFRPFFLQGADYQLFQESTLRNLLAIPGDDVRKSRFKIYYSMSVKPWFCEIFSDAGGFASLEEDIAIISPFWLPLCIRTLSNIAAFATTYAQLVQCARCIRDCLVRSPYSKEENRYGAQCQQFRSILDRQRECRGNICTAMLFRAPASYSADLSPSLRTSSSPNSSSLSLASKDEKHIHYDYVQGWSAPDWEDWYRFIEGVIEDLDRGHVVDTDPRTIYDPEKTCPNKHKNGMER